MINGNNLNSLTIDDVNNATQQETLSGNTIFIDATYQYFTFTGILPHNKPLIINDIYKQLSSNTVITLQLPSIYNQTTNKTIVSGGTQGTNTINVDNVDNLEEGKYIQASSGKLYKITDISGLTISVYPTFISNETGVVASTDLQIQCALKNKSSVSVDNSKLLTLNDIELKEII